MSLVRKCLGNNELIKGNAIKKVNERLGHTSLNSTNTHWANTSDYGQYRGWWLNIPFQKFEQDLNLILNDEDSMQFVHINIPAKTILKPEQLFRNKDNQTADIYIALPKTATLTSNSPLIDIQSNGLKHDFSLHEVNVYSSTDDINENDSNLPGAVATNPNYLLTKFWGFDPVNAPPVIGFGTDGGRTSCLRNYQPGDWVLIAATGTKNSSNDDKYRLLGKIQISAQLVDADAVYSEYFNEGDSHLFDDNGVFLWPHGIIITRACVCPEKPDLKDIFGDRLPGQHWAAYAPKISDHYGQDVIDKINQIKFLEVELSEISSKFNKLQSNLILNQESNWSLTGPAPSLERKAFEGSNDGGFVYVFKLTGANSEICKAGYTNDIDRRLKELNSGLCSSITGLKWELVFAQKLQNIEDAYKIEQDVHADQSLAKKRIEGEKEIYKIAPDKLRSIVTNKFIEHMSD